MKKSWLLLAVLAMGGCGYSSVQNELTGQVKKVIRYTPILCPDYTVADVSLGVLRHGVGSLSKEDVELVVSDQDQIEMLQHAIETGSLVKVQYNEKRITFCTDDKFLVDVKVLQ